MSGVTHHVGDGCPPDGHRTDPFLTGVAAHVCVHGKLARSCEVCDLEAEVVRLRAEVARLRVLLDQEDDRG